ncbi:hypothetical protein ACFL2U_01235 [Patescibacteria group bacterium]
MAVKDKPKHAIGTQVAVKFKKGRETRIGTIIKSAEAQPGQLARKPGTMVYLIRIVQHINENGEKTYYNQPPFPMTTAIDKEIQPIQKQKKST